MRSLKEHADVVAGDSSRFTSQFCWQPGDISPVGNFWEEVKPQQYKTASDKTNDFINRSFAVRREPASRYPVNVRLHEDELHNQMAHRTKTYGHDYTWGDNNDDPAAENLPLHHRNYKTDSGSYFNKKLRNPSNHHEDGHIDLHTAPIGGGHAYNTPKSSFDQMDKITSHPTIKPMSLYRGFGNEMHRTMRTIAPGAEFVDHGYTGLSVHRHTAASYGASGGFGAHHHDPLGPSTRTIAMVHVPAGTFGHMLDHPHDQSSPLNEEGEFLLHRGTHFRVMGHSQAEGPSHSNDKFHVVHLQVLGQHPKPIREPQRMEPKE